VCLGLSAPDRNENLHFFVNFAILVNLPKIAMVTDCNTELYNAFKRGKILYYSFFPGFVLGVESRRHVPVFSRDSVLDTTPNF